LADFILRFNDRPTLFIFKADRGRFLLEFLLSGIGEACKYFLSAFCEADFSKQTPSAV
jgi:hypothetical protein